MSHKQPKKHVSWLIICNTVRITVLGVEGSFVIIICNGVYNTVSVDVWSG